MDIDKAIGEEYCLGMESMQPIEHKGLGNFKAASLLLVRTERLELSRVAPLGPKPSASTSFATSAFYRPVGQCISILLNYSYKVKFVLYLR